MVTAEVQYKIGLGSCNNQNYPTPAWDALEEENLDAFFFLGDNVYGDIPSGELDYLKQSYELFASVMPKWLKETELLVIWDDHDFGLNDGGSSYKYKSQSQKLFNDFLIETLSLVLFIFLSFFLFLSFLFILLLNFFIISFFLLFLKQIDLFP